MEDRVAVSFALGRVLGMKLQGDFFDLKDRDVFRKIGVEREADLRECPVGFDLEIGDLAYRMHAAVGASGTMQANGSIEDPLQNLFDLSLNGPLLFILNLPAVEFGAIVFDGEFEVAGFAHSSWLRAHSEIQFSNFL